MYRGLVFVVLLLISMETDASKISVFRKLAKVSQTPSPSPVSPPDPVVKETCEMASNKCHYESNMTACISYPGTGPQELQLIVVNDGDTPLKVKVTILPANESYEGIDIPKHEAKKVRIKTNVEGNSSIILNVGPGDCIIQMGSRSEPNLYSSYLTPTNGAILLLASAIIIGVSWVSCKSVKENRHLEGIPYQELEMGQPGSLLSPKVETTNGWDQSWDDDWDEDNAVKSPTKNGNGNGNGKRVLSRQVNGLNPPKDSSNSEGWENDWDD